MTADARSRTAAREVPVALQINARIAQMLARTAASAIAVSAAKNDHQRCFTSELDSLLLQLVPLLIS
jgi:hypothetical protein